MYCIYYFKQLKPESLSFDMFNNALLDKRVGGMNSLASPIPFGSRVGSCY